MTQSASALRRATITKWLATLGTVGVIAAAAPAAAFALGTGGGNGGDPPQVPTPFSINTITAQVPLPGGNVITTVEPCPPGQVSFSIQESNGFLLVVNQCAFG